MNNKLKKYATYSILPVAAIALLLTNSASAHGWGWNKDASPTEIAQHQQSMFEEQASLLNTDVNTVKNAWAQGKNLQALAEELGISETDLQTKMKAARQEQMKTHLQTLVEQGVITQAQADQRYASMEQRAANNTDKPGMGMGRGGRHGGGLGGFGW